jgi:hypothetical protein
MEISSNLEDEHDPFHAYAGNAGGVSRSGDRGLAE